MQPFYFWLRKQRSLRQREMGVGDPAAPVVHTHATPEQWQEQPSHSLFSLSCPASPPSGGNWEDLALCHAVPTAQAFLEGWGREGCLEKGERLRDTGWPLFYLRLQPLTPRHHSHAGQRQEGGSHSCRAGSR